MFAATPHVIVKHLHLAFKGIGAMPTIRQRIADMGLVPVDTPSLADLRDFLAAEVARWGDLVQQLGIAHSL